MISNLIRSVFALCLVSQLALCWPREHGVFDANGDCRVVISVVGDSFVSGVGDKKAGGYVGRVRRSLPRIDFQQLAKPGLEARQLFRKLRRTLKSEDSAYFRKLSSSDVIILDVGRNDRWLFGEPIQTARTLWRIRKFISRTLSSRTGFSPTIVISALMLPNRGAQGPWVKELNRIIVSRHSRKNPSDLRFDLVSKTLLADDNLHPSPAGHQALANTLRVYIKQKLKRLVKLNFHDSDRDGLADLAELLRWGTDPLNPDTDGNLLKDGVQICR